MPLPPDQLLALGLAAVAVGGAVVAYLRRGGTVEIDADEDGEPEVTLSDEGCDDESDVDTSESEGNETSKFSTEEPDPSPVPEDVVDIGDDLEDIKGIGPQRARTLKGEGFFIATDLYFVSDEQLMELSGFGSQAVEYIRSDIGGIDYEDDGSSDENSDE